MQFVLSDLIVQLVTKFSLQWPTATTLVFSNYFQNNYACVVVLGAFSIAELFLIVLMLVLNSVLEPMTNSQV